MKTVSQLSVAPVKGMALVHPDEISLERPTTHDLMLNLLGDIWFADASSHQREPDWLQVLTHPAAKLHLYGKKEARRGRKMGHVTCVADTIEEALAMARAIKRDLGIPDDLPAHRS